MTSQGMSMDRDVTVRVEGLSKLYRLGMQDVCKQPRPRISEIKVAIAIIGIDTAGKLEQVDRCLLVIAADRIKTRIDSCCFSRYPVNLPYHRPCS